MTPSSRVNPVLSCGPSNFDVVEMTVRAAPAGRCVDRAASQRAGSTATTPSLTSRRCAPSPCATRAPIPHSAPCSQARCLDSIFADPPTPCVVRRRRRVLRVNGGMVPPDELALRQAREGAQLPRQLEFGPLPALPARCPVTICLDPRLQAPPRARRSASAASARRPTPWASSRAPPPPPPISLAPAAAALARCAERAKNAACTCVGPCVGPLRGLMPPPPPRRCPGLAPTSATAHPAPFAASAQAAAPSQRRRSAAAACRRTGRRGRRAAHNGRNGRRTLVPAAVAARAAYGSVGGVRRALGTRSAAGADAGKPPGGRHLRASRRCDLAVARLEPFGASGGSEAAPAGLGPAWRWPTVAPGPAGAAAARLVLRGVRPNASSLLCRMCGIFSRFVEICVG